MNDSEPPLVGVVILNWCGAEDTIRCIDSVLRMTYRRMVVIVVDNGSPDNSEEKIRSWLRSEQGAGRLRLPDADESAPSIGDENLICVHLMQSGANLGYAGGNNVGLRDAFVNRKTEYVWILNNDTIVKEDSLTRLMAKVARAPDVGLCGSTLLYLGSGDDGVQAAGGGRFNPVWGRATEIRMPLHDLESKEAEIERGLDYISGAATLVSARMWEIVGGMTEDYFLYFEELDWAHRLCGGLRLGYAAESIVYHKEGASIGTDARNRGQRSMLADFYGTRNRLLFTARFYPMFLPTVCVAILAAGLYRILRGDGRRGAMMVGLLFSAWKRPRWIPN